MTRSHSHLIPELLTVQKWATQRSMSAPRLRQNIIHPRCSAETRQVKTPLIYCVLHFYVYCQQAHLIWLNSTDNTLKWNQLMITDAYCPQSGHKWSQTFSDSRSAAEWETERAVGRPRGQREIRAGQTGRQTVCVCVWNQLSHMRSMKHKNTQLTERLPTLALTDDGSVY